MSARNLARRARRFHPATSLLVLGGRRVGRAAVDPSPSRRRAGSDTCSEVARDATSSPVRVSTRSLPRSPPLLAATAPRRPLVPADVGLRWPRSAPTMPCAQRARSEHRAATGLDSPTSILCLQRPSRLTFADKTRSGVVRAAALAPPPRTDGVGAGTRAARSISWRESGESPVQARQHRRRTLHDRSAPRRVGGGTVRLQLVVERLRVDAQDLGSAGLVALGRRQHP